MKTKHTPGPWLVVKEDGFIKIQSPILNRPFIDLALVYKGERFEGSEDANARLIAAAPDLYDRADRLLEEYGNTGTVSRESMLELQKIMAKLTPKFKTKATGGAE